MRQSEDERPVWADRAPEPENGRAFFVGRSTVLNIADEQQGVSQAMDDSIRQISKATGADIGDHSNNAVEQNKSSRQIDTGGSVVGLRQEAMYCQRGYLHNEVSPEFRRFQYYILISVPQTELTRLENKTRNQAATTLDSLLAEAQTFVHAGSLIKAREILKSTVGLYPNAPTAWTALADVEEKLSDWDGAFSAWDSLRQLAVDSSTKSFAQASLNRVNDERVIVRITQAEQKAQAEQFSDALDTLTEASNLKPSARVFERLQNRYFNFFGLWFELKIKAAMTSHKWKTLAVANFTGGSGVESLSVRDRIYSVLSRSSESKPNILFLSESAIAYLRQGRFDMLPEKEQRQIEQTKADAVVFGVIGRQIDIYLFDISHQQTQPLLSVNSLGSVPAFPSNVEAWLRLPAKSSTSRGLRVEIWTDKTSYPIGNEVEFHLRSNRDCYMTLLDLQTSGGLYVLFPNSFQRGNFVQANRIYTIPSLEAPFSINASSPTGIEGVKAIAATKPIALEDLISASGFVVARTPIMQESIVNGVLSAVKNLSADEWDVAEWTFEISK